MYPTPRMAWIMRDPCASNFWRSALMCTSTRWTSASYPQTWPEELARVRPGHEDDREVVPLAQAASDLDAMQAGQAAIDEGKVGLERDRRSQSRRPVSHRADVVPVVLEDRRQEVAGRGSVVDHQHAKGIHRRYLLVRNPLGQAPAARRRASARVASIRFANRFAEGVAISVLTHEG